ncbi:unnamed protein product, partial [marine sediment metagenome]
LDNNLSSLRAGSRAYINNMVRTFDNIFIVLDYQNGITQPTKPPQYAQ